MTNTPEHQALALEAARRSIVLLKNDRRTLPLDRTRLRTLAVIGPNAKGLHLGGYSSFPGRGVDVLSGIAAAAGPGVRVLHAEGVRITEHEANWNDESFSAIPRGTARGCRRPCGSRGSRTPSSW